MKIFIVGNIASGKTTLSNELSNYLELPLFHIDEIVHDDINNIKRTEEEQIKIINDINRNNKEWIIEGVPRNNLDILCNISETIIFLDYDKDTLIKRLKKRHKKDKLKYDVTLEEEINWIDTFNYEKIYEQLKKHIRKGIIIKNDKELKKYMESIYESYKY